MNFALVYIVRRFIYRLVDFFHHWYVDGSRNAFHYFLSTLEAADRTLSVRITLRHFFEPLYKDYTIVGRVLGIVFRSGRVLIGGAVYGFLAVMFLAIYAVWLTIPLFIIYGIYGAGIR